MRARAIVAWILVVPCVAWLVVRVLGLERGYPMVPLLAFTPATSSAAGSAPRGPRTAASRRR